MTPVLGSAWVGRTANIGIVVFNNGVEDKAYIAVVGGDHERQSDDEQYVLNFGTPFPLEPGKVLCGLK